jgi:hypothetical protein
MIHRSPEHKTGVRDALNLWKNPEPDQPALDGSQIDLQANAIDYAAGELTKAKLKNLIS